VNLFLPPWGKARKGVIHDPYSDLNDHIFIMILFSIKKNKVILGTIVIN